MTLMAHGATPCSRYRATMVVREDVVGQAPQTQGARERHARRKASAGSRRRRSLDRISHKKDSASPTVYQVLIHLIFAIASFRPMYAQDAFDTLASLTSSRKRSVTEEESMHLEEAFNVLHHGLDHLFMPWVRTPSLRGEAVAVLDLPFLVDVVLALEREAVHLPEVTKREVQAMRRPVDKFLRLVGATRRQTM